MRVTTRGRYAVMAMFDLACRRSAEAVPLKQIAEHQGLSERYLEQLMAPLRRAGLVRSVRGAQGGYTLGRPPGAISVGDILRVVEGPISPVACVANPLACARTDGCVTRGIWSRLRDRMVELLDSISLADLCQEAASEPFTGGVDDHARSLS
ncbi:MAG TPA: Rrf2 family transcriptional regulator [Bacillota bacterium]|nr:Rrf2 family transcriptional regulator [Bacillota bacterium]